MSSIIDNSPENLLVTEVNELLDHSEFSRMAVGYFYLSGFEAIREKLNKVKYLKLVIGNRTNQETVEQLVKGHANKEVIENEIRRQLRQNKSQRENIKIDTSSAYANDLTYMEQNEGNEVGLKALFQLIEEKRVEIRVYTKGFLHSKAYIFEDPSNKFAPEGAAIIGSSNLSISGLRNNSELNVKLSHPEDIKDIKSWFDKIWDESEEFSLDIMQVISNSWANRQATPYEIYIKTLYHLVKDRVNIKEYLELSKIGFDFETLFPFQRDAFNMALNKLENTDIIQNGIFIADVVGLGKSYIALALISYYWSVKRKNTLIICPASLKSMWEEYKAVYQLHCRIIASSELAYKDDNTDYTLNDEPSFDGYEVVVIDEAHNFRNPDTQKYKILAPYLQDKKTILLTATPQNKSVWDVYHQIKLFHQSDITNLNITPNNLKTFFQENEENPEKIAELLQNFVIRRTRNDIKNSPKYKDFEMEFPKRKLITIDYEIDSTYSTDGTTSIYETIFDKLFKKERKDRYQYSIYDLTGFLKDENKGDKTYQGLSYFGDLCRGLLKTLLFKRLESSVVAFYDSITRMIKRHNFILQLIEQRNVVVTGSVENIELFIEFSDFNEYNIGRLNEYPVEDFKKDKLVKAIKQDIKILTEVINSIELLIKKPELDNKFNQFIEKVINPNKSQKILIFSEFSETVQYLYRRTKEQLPHVVMSNISSKAKTDEKSDIIRRFSPKSQTSFGLNEYEKEIQILFTTDVLSEGQNLQDSHIIVNYDFHWNPVRLIQRIGRIDRIGSEAKEIKIFNFLPDVNIERQLDLRSRVQNRINQIHLIFGSDSEILSHDEDLNENSLFAIYSDQNEAILDSDNNISTVFDKAERLLLELQKNNIEEYQRIINLEDGIRAACQIEKTGTFAFFTSGNLSRLYFHDGKQIIDSLPEILKIIEANPVNPESKPLDSAEHIKKMKPLYQHFKNELRKRQQEISSDQITPEQKHFVEKLKASYNLFNVNDHELKQRINKLSLIFSKEIPDYAETRLRKLKRENLSDTSILEALENLVKIANIEEFQKRLVQSEKMMIKTICSESFI